MISLADKSLTKQGLDGVDSAAAAIAQLANDRFTTPQSKDPAAILVLFIDGERAGRSRDRTANCRDVRSGSVDYLTAAGRRKLNAQSSIAIGVVHTFLRRFSRRLTPPLFAARTPPPPSPQSPRPRLPASLARSPSFTQIPSVRCEPSSHNDTLLCKGPSTNIPSLPQAE